MDKTKPRKIKTASTQTEAALHARGFHFIAGVDEAGRGPLAGPVVAAAVVLPPGLIIEGVYDSKKIAPARRAFLLEEIKINALAYGLGIIEAAEIDRINILQATMQAMSQAVTHAQEMLTARSTPAQIQYILVDGNRLPSLPCPGEAITKGDTLCHSIAAAAILAKETRDAIMHEVDVIYPGYGFATHKGYGTPAHLAALAQYGPCVAHRLTFKKAKPQ
ncbi:MAG: ribonuclease HII [Defluviitaleaceae bacterium]|nr:ribonuclease HII [Defluviitaleaceae bacterium]